MTASAVLLIRHATSEPPIADGSEALDNERPLTDDGRRAAERLAERLRGEPVGAVFSSPYRRAMETMQPIAAMHALPIRTLDDLRERRLSSSPLAEPAFLEALQRAREDPDLALPGGESTNDVRRRALHALDEIRCTAAAGVAVAGTHGGLISILRWQLGEAFTIDEALAAPMPAIYPFRWERDHWMIDGKAIPGSADRG